jgi:CHAT domain-containing protein
MTPSLKLFLFVIIGLSFSLEIKSADVEPIELQVSKPIFKPIKIDEIHTYTFQGEADKCLHLDTLQKGTDVIVKLFSPEDNEIAFVDRPNTTRGLEKLTFVLPTNGIYKVTVKGINYVELENGYSIELKPFTTPNERDLQQIKAEQLVSLAESLSTSDKGTKRNISIENFLQAIDLWSKLNDDYEKLVAIYGLGWVYMTNSEDEKAALYFGRGVVLARKMNEQFMLAHNLRSLGSAETRFGQFESAIISIEESFQIYKNLNSVRYMAISLHSLGDAQFFNDDLKNAEISFNEALIYRQTAKHSRGEVLTYTALAKLYNRLQDFQKSLEFIEKAKLKIKEINDKPSNYQETFIQEGWTYFYLKDYEKADNAFQNVKLVCENNHSPSGIAIALSGLSLVNQKKGKLKEALVNIEASLKIVEQLLNQINNHEYKLTFLSGIQPYYEIYINLLMQLNDEFPNENFAAKALEISEKARARNLLDLVNQSVNFNPKNLSIEKSKTYITFQSKYINLLKDIKKLTRTNNSEELKSNKNFDEVKPLNVKEIQNLLDEKTLLLEFGLYANKFGIDCAYLWAVSKNKVIGFSLPQKTLLTSTIKETYNVLTDKNHLVENNSTNELSQVLLKSLFDNPILQNKTKLLVVTNDVLQSIPFSALPNPIAKNELLIDKFEVVNLPSISILGALRNRQKTIKNNESLSALVLADPVFSQNDERFPKKILSKEMKGENYLRFSQYFGQNDLPRLFNTRFEAKVISSFLDNNHKKIDLDFAANRVNILNANLKPYSIIHFATHALIDDENPELSGIVLSLVDKNRNQVDGVLLSSDIFNLNLNADLVVLSGCRTGLGKPIWGEGFVGLTQNFLYAGTSRLLTSLWSVDDRATAQLMSYFYKNLLEKKLSYSESLQKAQIEMRKNPRWANPYYWAGFTLQGEYKETKNVK